MTQTLTSSRISGFHKHSVPERIALISKLTHLDSPDNELLTNCGNLPQDVGNHMIENFVGTMTIPVGIATNMKIDGKDVLTP